MATTTLSAVDKHADIDLSVDLLTATRSATARQGGVAYVRQHRTKTGDTISR